MNKRLIFIFLIILFVIISFYNTHSSSGMSVLNSNRAVGMRVVNSEEALISIPNEINLKMDFENQIINYYTIISEEVETEEKNELGEMIKETVFKEVFIRQEDDIILLDNIDNFTVINNMYDSIKIKSIKFSNDIWEAYGEGFTLTPSGSIDLNINLKEKYKNYDTYNELINNEEKLNVELTFTWDGGESIINKEVLLDINVINTTTDKFI